MKTFKFQGIEILINYASSSFVGHGHHRIEVEVTFNGSSATFKETTSNMYDFDKANDLDGQEKYEAFYKIIASNIEDEIVEWALALNEK